VTAAITMSSSLVAMPQLMMLPKNGSQPSTPRELCLMLAGRVGLPIQGQRIPIPVQWPPRDEQTSQLLFVSPGNNESSTGGMAIKVRVRVFGGGCKDSLLLTSYNSVCEGLIRGAPFLYYYFYYFYYLFII
jgi:hypothetical protein